MIVNYVKRSDVRGTWLESHFRWQIRTFWFGLLWVALCGLFVIAHARHRSDLIAWLPLGLVAIWFIYRIARGWLALNEPPAHVHLGARPMGAIGSLHCFTGSP